MRRHTAALIPARGGSKAVHRKNIEKLRDALLKDFNNNTGGFETISDWGKPYVKKFLENNFTEYTGNGAAYINYSENTHWQRFKFTSYGTCNPMENFAEMHGAYMKAPGAFAENKDLLHLLRKYQKWEIEAMYQRKGWQLPADDILDKMVELWEETRGM